MVEGYCVKCKKKNKMKAPAVNQTKRGGFMAKGACPKCGTTMCRIMSKTDAEASIKSGECTKNY